MKLVIVESPNKCNTISKYLGAGYKVMATKGHLRDLSKKGVGGFGIEPDSDFKAHYEIDSSKYKIVNELRAESKKAEEVILATDPDREGEAIAWHLAQILGLDLSKTKRLEFHEITKESINEAINNPRLIDMNLVQSQESRRIIDRVIGFKLSNIMQKKIKSRSAGRVQSATLKLICDHEDEIKNFVPEEYWSLSAEIGLDESVIKANFYGLNNKAKKISSKEVNDKILEQMGQFAKVSDIKTVSKKQESKPAFTTSSLQQEAFNQYGFSASKTASLAQELYEGIEIDGERIGLITYIRTDSTQLSASFIASATKYITEHIGKEYMGTIKRGSKVKNAQNAHEAIRPTSVYRFPEVLRPSFKRTDLYKLYKLIYQRAIASLMTPKEYETTTITFDSNGVTFKYDTEKTTFDGYTKVYRSKEDVPDVATPNVVLGNEYAIIKIKNQQEFTTPPARYSEAKVVKLMEEMGIGRPSTYASTIVTLIKRDYIVSQKGIITPTEVGYRTNHVLFKYFPEIIDVNYTANMETELDQIQDGVKSRVEVLNDFYYPFMDICDEKAKIMYNDDPVPAGRNCPKCGSPLVYKNSTFGEFVGCSNYPHCKYKELPEKEIEYLDETCPKCGKKLVYRYTTNHRRFVGCSGYPDCDFVRHEEANDKKVIKECPECGGNMVVKKYKGRSYLGCSNYPKCKHTEKYVYSKK